MLTESMGSLVTYIRGDNTSLNTALAGSQLGLQKFAKFAMGIGPAIAAGFLGYKGIKSFATFEEAMRNINTIAKESEDQLKNTSNQVLSMSNTFGKSAQEMTKALYDINSAGFLAASGIRILKEATTSAIAGLSTVEMSARAITGVLNSYDLEITKAGDISDILFRTVEKGVLTFSELTEHMGSALATASAAKIPFEVLAAAAATMTKKGMIASRTFISLNMFIMQMIKPTKEIQGLFKGLGFASSSAALETEGLAGALEIIRRETKGSADAIGALGFNVRGIRTAFSLITDGGKMFADNLADIATIAGRAGAKNRALAQQMKTLNYQFNRLSSNFKSLSIAFGEAITNGLGLKNVLSGLSSVIGFLTSNMQGWLGHVMNGIGRLASFAIGITSLVLTFKGLAWSLTAMTGLFKSFLTMLIKLEVFINIKLVSGLAKVGIGFAGLGANLLKIGRIGMGAFIGWEIGRWIKDITGITKIVETFWKNVGFYDWWNGTGDTEKEKKRLASGLKFAEKRLDLAKEEDKIRKATLLRSQNRMLTRDEWKDTDAYKSANESLTNALKQFENKKVEDSLQLLPLIDQTKVLTEKLYELEKQSKLLSMNALYGEQYKLFEDQLKIKEKILDTEARRIKKVKSLKDQLKDINNSIYLNTLTKAKKINYYEQERLKLVKQYKKETSDVGRLENEIATKELDKKLTELKKNKADKITASDSTTKYSDAIIKGSLEDYKASLGTNSIESKIETNTSIANKIAEKGNKILEKVATKLGSNPNSVTLTQGIIG